MMLSSFLFAACLTIINAEILLPSDPRILFIGRHEVVSCEWNCTDYSGWVDSDGDSCHKIVSKGYCPYAGDYRHDGFIATEACCGCSGGHHGTCVPHDPVFVFGWSGTQIEVQFTGKTISANVSGSSGGDRFMAVIDGKPLQPFTVASAAWKLYAINAGSEGNHHLSLWKISEDSRGPGKGRLGCTKFGGFKADAFQGHPERRKRRLEFIGDSDTVGFCCDGKPGGDDKERLYENSYDTWGAQLARALDAEYVALAVSSIGVADWPITPLITRALPFVGDSKWDMTAYVPDAVVMLIGPNDDSPNSETFRKKYMALMAQVVSNYRAAATKPKIIHVCAGSMNGFDPCTSIQTVNAEFNALNNGFKGFYTSMTKKSWDLLNKGKDAKKYQGCDSHYNVKGHARVAEEIMPQVSQILGW